MSCVLCTLVVAGLPVAGRGEAMLQFFNANYSYIADRIPELAEAGYTSLWLGAPTKAGSAWSIGYDLCDPFDIGGKDQRGGYATYYGTEADVHRMVEMAHRFGMRIYFDNVMNHRAYDVPGYNENTALDVYPGLVPEDFHLQKTADGFYRAWSGIDYNDEWQVLHMNTSDLLDLAQEPGDWNQNFGSNVGDWHLKPHFVRHPNNPEYYDRMPHPGNLTNISRGDIWNFNPDNGVNLYVGFDNKNAAGEITPELIAEYTNFFNIYGTNGLTKEIIADFPTFFEEDVGGYLCRNARWLTDRTKADGFRLDAVKHVRDAFFGKMDGTDEEKNKSNAGYLGNMQWQFNMTRGFSDYDKHRDTAFNEEAPRDDMIFFGEHLGYPPPQDGYFAAGMRLLDDSLRNALNGAFENSGLWGYDNPSHNSFGPALGIMHAQSHDNHIVSRKTLHHAYYLTRKGIGLIYTDGNNRAATLKGSGGAFPRWAETDYLGQWGQYQLPELLFIHQNFGWEGQWGFGNGDSGDRLAYERGIYTYDEDGNITGFMPSMLTVFNAAWEWWSPTWTSGHYPTNAYLYNYAQMYNPIFAEGDYQETSYAWGGWLQNGVLKMKSNSYNVWGYKNPDPSDLWAQAGGEVITLYDDGEMAEMVWVPRVDGVDGDPSYNPYGINPADAGMEEFPKFTYYMPIPRITKGTNVTFGLRVDGSAEWMKVRLDGGVDIHGDGVRDNPPAHAKDRDLGFEDASAFFTQRIWPEKFASTDTRSNKLGSAGASTFTFTMGAPGVTVVEANAVNDYSTSMGQLSWVYHNPTASDAPNGAQFTTDGGNLVIRYKADKQSRGVGFLYYTTDGSYPEGAGGYPANKTTHVVTNPSWDGDGGDKSVDWWKFSFPAPAVGTPVHYKIGAARRHGHEYDDPNNEWIGNSVWPGSPEAIAQKHAMLSQWMVTNQNLKTVTYYPHNDWGEQWTGLKDGFHLLTARPYVKRESWEPPLYNTFMRTFYLDTETPKGYIQYPANDNENVGQSEYGVIIRTDDTVKEVWYHVTDANDDNDGVGNGTTTNGIEWAQATKVGVWTEEMARDTEYPQVWRFNYERIPSGGQDAFIRVRLCEVSTAPATNWSKSSLVAVADEHYTQLTRTIKANGPSEEFFYVWPGKDGEMVETGWGVRLQFTPSMLDGASSWTDCFKVYVNAENNGSTLRGELHDNEAINLRFENGNQVIFDMPNVYNGQDNWLYGVEVTLDHGTFSKSAIRLVKHRGPLLPQVIIAQPQEVDSDGAPVYIRMKDTPEAATDPTLRQTPIVIQTDVYATNVAIQFTSPSGYVAALDFQGVTTNSTKASWEYTWTVTNPGVYRFDATVMVDTNSPLYPADGAPLSALTNTTSRKATVQFRELLPTTNTNDLDWDKDGIPNADEMKRTPLPEKDAEQWTQTEVHLYRATGRSTWPESPDSDGDGLPDALELGYRAPLSPAEDTGTDTNADGFPNFMGDLDPPFYNTTDNYDGGVPNTTGRGDGGDRSAQVAGSVTDPLNPDTDYDGIPDGVEDANRNGWVDGDGEALPLDWQYRGGKTWPNNKMDSGETWEETSPNAADSDGDGLSDGYGEDVNFNGRTDLFLIPYEGAEESEWIEITKEMYAGLGIGVDNYSTEYSNYAGSPKPYTSRVINYAALFGKYDVSAAVFTQEGAGPGTLQTNGWPRLVITETDPLTVDTDGDGLPDGWEVRYGFDPLDNGVYNFRTGQPGNPENGPDGNPDEDYYVLGGEEVPYTNLLEYQNNTHPRQHNSLNPSVSKDSIIIGRGKPMGSINGVTNYHELLDWKLSDLLALDEYDNGTWQSDIYKHVDGFDSSRDLVAFYFRDGGNSSLGGDDKLYFRVDLDDLVPYAEEHHLNVFVAINWRGYDGRLGLTGEVNLPEEVDAGSDMGWNAVVAVYDSGNGTVYIDTDPVNNTTYNYGDLAKTGVQSFPEAFHGAYFNSELDAIAFSIDRNMLMTRGNWTGLDPDALLFQVYTTRDYTANSGGEEGGAQSGDHGGRNDFCDLMGDDWLASSYGNNQDYISKNGYYRACISKTRNDWPYFNHVGKHIKVALLSHGNQAIEAGHTIQNIVDNGGGAGYQRPVKIHNIYTNAPLNLHITPTLAMALEWAEVGTSNHWFSGPLLNEQIRSGIQRGGIRLLGSTFSDHILRYFNDDYNRANVALATDILNSIYGDGSATNPVVSTNVFWTPERVLDSDSLKKVRNLGYAATIYDQNTHLLKWYGRNTSLGDNAYKLHRLWLLGEGGGELKAFTIANAADPYRFQNTDGGLALEMRHLFSRRARGADGQIATLFYMWEDLAQNEKADAYDKSLRWMANHPWIQLVSLDQTLAEDREDGQIYWADIPVTNSLQAQDWVQHASNENYDNWYYGSDRHESLADKHFELRAGDNTTVTPLAYGSLTNNSILSNAWAAVQGIQHADVKRLAYQTIFASTFETAFHIQNDSNPARWSYGEYMYPATGESGLQGFAWKAQGQTRKAALYAAVDDWAGRELAAVEVLATDVDLDGEEEYILRNNCVMALFERSGGRMVGAWHKDGGRVYQMIGHFASQPESGWEDEGVNLEDARRTSALKDWWGGTEDQVNALYTVTTNAASITLANNGITKTVSLVSAGTNAFAVAYTMPGKTLYVRNGLSPDLNTLLTTGQKNLSVTSNTTSVLELMTLNETVGKGIRAKVVVETGSINTNASDHYTNTLNTVNMRTQAQTHQVELSGTGALAFQLVLGTEAFSRPVITFAPEGPYEMPVGYTNGFTVTATNSAGAAVAVTATNLPEGSTFVGNRFEWPVANLTPWFRVTNAVFQVTFTAADAGLSTSAVAHITVPWDANGNGMGDDWEYVRFRKDMTQTADGDPDGDGFPNYSEWIANTNPLGEHDYIGWESLYMNELGEEVLTFKCVPNRIYRIQSTDGAGMAATTNWPTLDSVTSHSEQTQYIWTNTVKTNIQMYRIAIPRFDIR